MEQVMSDVVESGASKVINYEPIFPLMTASVKLDLPIQDMAVDVLELAKQEKNYSGGYTTYFNKQVVDMLRGVSDLKETIYGVCAAFGRELKYELNYDRCAIELWASVIRKGGYHPPHNHARSMFSGTFYVNVDADMSPLVLMNPTTPFRMHEGFVRDADKGPFTSDVLVLKPENNQMIIWPSWLNHYVPEMEVDKSRIAFSFNVDYLPIGA
ncbi:hypothetical protein EBT25_05790 [bacterium]|nr:hypothetical protein [bacterium]